MEEMNRNPQIRIKLWGVRGSLPAPLSPNDIQERIVRAVRNFFDRGFTSKKDIPAFVETLSPGEAGGFGGNTPCVEVTAGNAHVIIDGGSGIRNLGHQLMKGPCGKGQGVVNLFMTHFHWDHLIGLPFFTPLYVPGNVVNVYAVQPDLKDAFSALFRKPFFPIELSQLRSTIRFHTLAPREKVMIEDLEITPYQLDHPDPCWGYRFERGGKAFAHCVDGEMTRFTREELGPDLPLYQNVDLMIFDAQYALVESISKETWGHGTPTVGLDVAVREGVKSVIFMHHDPAATDEKIHGLEVHTKKYHRSQEKLAGRQQEELPWIDWGFAREEMVIEL
jgi:phosphoribosyl 1,2-cyclic phosphodiesterase